LTLVLSRVTGEGHAAAHEPLVEAGEPTQAVLILQIDMPWMDNLLDRRRPAKITSPDVTR